MFAAALSQYGMCRVNPATDVDSENENDDDNDVNSNGVLDVTGAVVAPVAAPVVVSGAAVVPEVVPAGNPSEPGSGSADGVEEMSVDVRDNELDEVVSQPLLVSGSGGAEERVLDSSASQFSVIILETSTDQVGVPQEEVLESSPTFSPLSGSVLSVTPSSGVSEVGVDSGDDAPASVVDSGPLRSKIPVKVGRSVSGGLHPPLVSREETANMVQKLKASLPSSTDDLVASGQAGGSSQLSHAFAVPLPPRVSSRSSGSGMALRTSSRSRSRPGDERTPLSPLTRILIGLVVVLPRLALLGAVKFAVISPFFFVFRYGFVTTFLLYYGSHCNFC